MIEIVSAKFEHVIAIVEDMRAREKLAITETPEKALTQALAKSFVAWTALVDDRPAAMWGAFTSGLLADEADIWFIGTQTAEAHPIALLRRSHYVINQFRQYFKHLNGYVFADFEKSVAWLRWLGFEVGPPINGVRRFRSV